MKKELKYKVNQRVQYVIAGVVQFYGTIAIAEQKRGIKPYTIMTDEGKERYSSEELLRPALSAKEQEVIDLLRRDRAGKDSVPYDCHIHGNDAEKHRALLTELQWQAMNGPGEDLTRWYGVDTISKLCLLKLPV